MNRIPARSRWFRTSRLGRWLLPWLVAAVIAGGLRAAPKDRPADLQVRDAWVRWLPGDLPAAGYLTLVNPTDSDRFLTGASSKDYAAVMLHQSYTLPDGSSGMRPVDRLRVPAGGEVRLEPGGYHLMLMQPRHAIAPGASVGLVLTFADGGSLSVALPVKSADQGG